MDTQYISIAACVNPPFSFPQLLIEAQKIFLLRPIHIVITPQDGPHFLQLPTGAT